MTKILQTKLIGMTQHQSGHPLAPMDIVYEVENEPRRDGSRLFSDEWSAPNPWVTAAIWAFVVIPCATYAIWHVLTN